jgi:ferrous-iron efflux pump FieF
MSAGEGQSHTNADASARGSLTTRAAVLSITVALFLVAIKSWAAWQTGSSAMLASLGDTALDLVASLVTLAGVRVAMQPADDQHRFGHGKAEALAAMVQVMLISMSALAIGWNAVQRWITGALPTAPETGIAVSLAAMVVTFGLLAYQRRVIARTGSVAIQADHLHYQSDLLLNAAVIAALVLDSYAGLHGADPAFGIVIALWLLFGAWRTANHVVDQLMDREWSADRKLAFIDVVMQHPEARGIHDLRTRTSGTQDFVQFHLWVRPDMTVMEAHGVIDRIESELATSFPGLEILIHTDPEGHHDTLGYMPSEGLEHRALD